MPSASGFGLLGLTDSTDCDRLDLRFGSGFGAGDILPPWSRDAPRDTVGRSREPLRDVDPTIWGPTMLIRAIVSGEGERRIPSGASTMGEDGAEEVNGSEERLSGSGRLNGAGAGSAWVI